MRIQFLGAAREVTGSCYLVEAGGARFLVDCGLFQGGREAAPRNRAFPAFDASRLDFALVTHAHLDHCGLLPVLIRRAPRLPVYCTRPTADLLPVMLQDSAHIQLRDYEHNARRRDSPPPLYTPPEVERAMRQVSGVPYGVEFRPHPEVAVRFLDAGHILGSAILDIRVREEGKSRRLVCSGDLGQPARPIVNDPQTVSAADVLLVESTYGNRQHKSLEDTLRELLTAIDETLFRHKGNLVVPAFALGRTQEFLYLLQALCEQGELPRLNVFVDSPLARRATDVTLAHHEALDPMAQRFAAALHAGRLAYRLRFTQTPAESIAVNKIRSGAIIVAASGMCDAGRIRHHLRHALPREECGILFTGFQAGGTLGRRIVEGAKSVRLFGEAVPVRAKVYTLGGLSAHADQAALLSWLETIRRPPQHTFVVHGEEATALAFSAAVAERRGWPVTVPVRGEAYDC